MAQSFVTTPSTVKNFICSRKTDLSSWHTSMTEKLTTTCTVFELYANWGKRMDGSATIQKFIETMEESIKLAIVV
jgi:hypothetical protein